MLDLRKIAVTGGLASGKTSVCRVFKELGAYVLSADEIVHQLLSLNTAVGQQVLGLLGSGVLNNGKLDRKKIAESLFSEPQKLKALEKVIHPLVLDEIENCYQRVRAEEGYSLFVAEIPLLYESESEGRFDAVIAVTAHPSLCRERFQQSTGSSPEEYDRRMTFQLSTEEKAARADFIITNEGDLSALNHQVLSILKELHSRWIKKT
jgi:dephospho-CoA kinase